MIFPSSTVLDVSCGLSFGRFFGDDVREGFTEDGFLDTSGEEPVAGFAGSSVPDVVVSDLSLGEEVPDGFIQEETEVLTSDLAGVKRATSAALITTSFFASQVPC